MKAYSIIGNYPNTLFSVSLVYLFGWREPICWTGPKVVLYQSFDASSGLVLMEGTEQVVSFPLVSGKVNEIFTSYYGYLGFNSMSYD